jgi:3-oxoacyl-[acyl-carrier protein] reductase
VKLENKVCIITGASQGIGRATALLFAKEGARLVINGRNRKRIKIVCDEIRDVGGVALPVVADVSKSSQVSRMVQKTVKEFGGIDVLINNAGVYEIISMLDMTEEKWDRVIEINLKGTFNCVKAVLPIMLKRGRGKIINMGSIAGKTGGALPLAHYAASKAAVMCFTRSLASEFGPMGLNVNAVCPGVIETGMTKEIVREKKRLIPLKRIGQPEDVAQAILFLASDESNYITGEIMDVNGGLLMD